MVTDLFGVNGSKSIEVNITLINDQPPNISLPASNVTFMEDMGQLQLFTTAPNISDPDDNPNQRSIIYSASLVLLGHNSDFERLTFNDSSSYNNSIVGSFNGDILQLSGNGTVDDYKEVCMYVHTSVCTMY